VSTEERRKERRGKRLTTEGTEKPQKWPFAGNAQGKQRRMRGLEGSRT
jgi:hypothetical protein